ncbi:methionine--tRNA ligase [Halarsenatibacter silvermanii]|uniref:Methionine--tRNA ligase n=1 Tax=Halarsenatibacter silvermanii TaxID=321763 RepID=A0A1G9QY88_9FIRM|nr:methionine--tRNA ligase [Halarsenatibacter silvermanii]SDM16002.1 methionyl-tRNA synthetase [Halarsenatibacter silvermanii]
MTEEQSDTFYVTTPIYYPSDRLHIGHAYTTVAADAIARFKEMKGYDTVFLTGSDEHGQKIERRAAEAEENPKDFVDEIVGTFVDLWQTLGIDYDQFIRTTDQYHKDAVQHIFDTLHDKGDIYLDEYEGWYCTPCETYWREHQIGTENECPDCGRELEWVEEESYFFRLSDYADDLYSHIKENPQFIQPESRRNEMLSFIEDGLEDLSVSRTTFDWGIDVPFDEDHVVYVWIDALSNYITALGYPESDQRFEKYWPADIHIVGKDILRFHTIIWPAILMGLDLPLPEQVFGHGWLLTETGKMSKSRGNVVDPMELSEDFGRDAIRYYLLREVPFGSDGTYSTEALINRINSDLANDLGNLLHRTLSMVEQNFAGVIPAPDKKSEIDKDLKNMALKTARSVADQIDGLRYTQALEELMNFVRRSNKYIDETRPWILAEDEDQHDRLKTVLYNLLEALRFISIMLKPFMVDTPEEIGHQMGCRREIVMSDWSDLDEWGQLPVGRSVRKGDPIYPRIDLEEYFAGKEETEEVDSETEQTQEEKKEMPEGLISFREFQRLELKVAKIEEAERISGSDKLLRLVIEIGEDEKRQLVAGLARHYSAEELMDKQIAVIENLEPAEIFGVESQGMLLAAEDKDGSLSLLEPDVRVEPGAEIS